MLIDDPKEMEAAMNWNLAMHLKKRERRILCRSFQNWRSQTRIIDDSHTFTLSDLQSIRKKATRTNIPTDLSLQALKEELEQLKAEQKDLERMTDNVRLSLSAYKPQFAYTKRISLSPMRPSQFS